MSQQQAPWLETAFGWNLGEGGWNSGMDSNLLKFSVMFDRNVDSIVASLPAAINGQVHYLTTDNRIYFAVGITYYSTPVPKWFSIVERGTGNTWQFNGSTLSAVDSINSLDTRLDAVELTLSNLGSAAFEDIDAFATQAELDVVEAQSQAYTDDLRQELFDDGSELVRVKSPLANAILRGLGTRAEDWVSARDFGAVADGDAVAGTGTDNWDFIQNALATGKHVHCPGPGIYRIHEKELQMVRAGQILSGEGMGSSYGPSSLRNHVHHTTLMFTGAGESYVKTRRQPREVVGDPNDAPLSTAINIQNEGIGIRDIAIFCHCNYASDETVANLGADWDVGIFNGSRALMHLQRVRVIGYWRVAGTYVDVTYAMTMPRFTNPRTAAPFPAGTYSGADRITLEDVWAQGGRKGLWIAGAINTASGDYYDGVSAATLPDQGNRGGAGCSEFVASRCFLWGRDHHSGWRAYDPRVDMNFDLEDLEDVSAPLVIDGRRDGGTQNRLRRLMFNECRFQTFEAVRIGLGRSYEVYFTNTDTEPTSGTVYDTAGALITQSDPLVNYGPCARVTPSGSNVGADRIFFYGINNPPTAVHFQDKGGRYGLAADAFGASNQYNIGFQNQLNFPQGGFIHRNGTDLVIRSSPTTSNGTNLQVLAAGQATLEGATSARLRVNGQSRVDATTTEVVFYTTMRAATDNAIDFGTASNRLREIFAGNNVINTSDEREKCQQREQLEAERLAALDLKQALRAFKWKDSVERKGDGARWHFGVMAQEVVRIFERHGLDASTYSMLCYDEWDEMPEQIQKWENEYDEDGNLLREAGSEIIQPYQAAGNRYGVRYDQLLAFIISAM